MGEESFVGMLMFMLSFALSRIQEGDCRIFECMSISGCLSQIMTGNSYLRSLPHLLGFPVHPLFGEILVNSKFGSLILRVQDINIVY